MRDLLDSVELMTDDEAGKLLKAIINHVDGRECDLPREIVFAFTPIKNQLTRDNDKYSQYIEKQREIGKKGGRPKKRVEKGRLSKKGSQTLTDTVTVNDTANVTVTDNATDTVNDNKDYKSVKDLNIIAFEKYLSYRKEAGIKKLTKQGEYLAAKKLVSFGSQKEVVDQSIGNGWAGLFPLKKEGLNNKKQDRIDKFNEWLDSEEPIDGEYNVIN